MTMCSRHWQKLRTAIKAAGLEAFVAESAQEAAQRMHAKNAGEKGRHTFEPLIGANLRVVAYAITEFGPEIARTDRCPACAGHPSWIEDAVAAERMVAHVGGFLNAQA